jgi:hypothetical protein
MKLFTAVLSTALLAAVAAPAHARVDCDDDIRTLFERLQRDAGATMSKGDKIADVMRRTVRAYDACRSGDDFSLRGVWDQIEKEKGK